MDINKSIKQFVFPGDKSISHRLILLSLILNKKLILENIPSGKDVNTSLNIVKQLGVEVTANNNRLYLNNGLRTDSNTSLRSVSRDNPATWQSIKNNFLTNKLNNEEEYITLDCGNSGTTARLLCGILANLKGNYKLIGDESLSKRPMERVTKPLAELMGIKIKDTDRHLPIYIDSDGNSTATEFYNKTGSAQVKSAVLFAGLASNGVTKVKEDIKSRDHTERVLKYLSEHEKDEEIKFVIPGDISSAAYLIVAAIITAKCIKISNILLNPTRTGFLKVLKRMGANIQEKIIYNSWEPCGDIIVKGSTLSATNILLEEIPSVIDELPILSIAMVFAKGKSTVRGASELRVKESDRIRGLISQLKKVGVTCEEKTDGYEITGLSEIHSSELDSFNDHRLAMSFAVLAYCSNKKIEIKNKESIDISFPEFYEYLNKL